MSSSSVLATSLHEGMMCLGLDLPQTVEARLLDYLALLSKWNRVYNLTAVRDERQMVVQHLLDSLAVLPYLTGYTRLADVGSGGGLPGIPLALARPDLVVTLIESNHKKATFLQQAKIELGLNHVSVYCGRVEDYKPTAPLDAGISRAFAEIALFVRVAGHLVVGDAPLLAMKGVDPLEEIAQLPPGWRVAQTQPLKVPGLDAQRHLISIIRN